MAKSTALEILNKVQSNLGEVKTNAGSFASISGLALLIFNSMNEVLLELANEYKYMDLETDISVTLSSNTATYTSSVALTEFDKDSFNYNNEKPIPYYTTQRMDRDFPIKTNTGVPKVAWYWGGYFRVHPIPAASEHGKVLRFRGWKVPDLYSTASTAGTSFVYEGHDLTLLANWVTFKVLAYKSNPEAQVYYSKVFGTSDGKMLGQLAQYKANRGSPQLLDNSIMVEPMEGNRQSGFVQSPISG